MTVMITLNQIRHNHPTGLPCKDGWTKLLRGLGKNEADDEQFPLVFVLENNGIDDALWCVECLRGHDYAVFNLKADIAKSVLHIFEKERPNDTRVRDCISATRAFANGEITRDELASARDAAWDAALATESYAARVAALAAARDAAWDAARDAAAATASAAARDAAAATASAAAGDAAWSAAGDAAWDAARATERAKQELMFRKWFR